MQIRYILFVVVSFVALSCGPKRTNTALDVESLLVNGDCQTILEKASNATPFEAASRIICQLMNAPTDASAAQAELKPLDRKTQTDTVLSMLNVAPLYPTLNTNQSIAVINFANKHSESIPSENITDSKELAVSIIEYIATTHIKVVPESRLGEIAILLNYCLKLLGNTFVADTDYQAWRLYVNFSEIALHVWNPLEQTELAKQLMHAVINTVNQNPQISVAAKCDLGTPYDRLKSALSKDTELLGPFERAVSAAMGCSRGRYAPTP